MTISLKHAFTSAKADGTDSTLIQPSNWNAEHTLTLATARLVGRTTAGAGAAEEITVSAPLSLSATNLTHNTSGATAGTYIKVTIDAYGHVTGSSALLASDITSALTYTPFNKVGDSVNAASSASFTGTAALTHMALRDSSSTYTNHTGIDFGTAGNGTIPVARIAMQYTSAGSYLKFGTSNTYASGITNTGMTLDYSGNLTVAANVTAYSDERYKTNWRSLDRGFLKGLTEIKAGIYDRTDDNLTQVGVSAQDLQSILPTAVHEDSQGILSVAYGNAALVAAVELAKEVQRLHTEIETLKARIGG